MNNLKLILDFLRSIDAKIVGLILCTMPLVLHTSVVFANNEHTDLPSWIVWSLSIIAAIGFEYTIVIATLDPKKTFTWASYVFAGISFIINIAYSNESYINWFLAIVLPFSVLIYSHLVKEAQIPRKRGSKDVDPIEFV